jgi:heme exporter protein CcmD
MSDPTPFVWGAYGATGVMLLVEIVRLWRALQRSRTQALQADDEETA